MKADIKRRLAEIEMMSKTDWFSQLSTVDYFGMEDYEDGSWQELHYDETITVLRNKQSGEVRGVYHDRRTDDEIEAAGGDLAYV